MDNQITITLRPVVRGDAAFLLGLYASTREQELALTPWNPEQRQAFLEMQFAAQQRHYANAYPDAAHDIILVDGQPAGQSYVAREPDRIHIVDLTLLPGYRGAGLGARLVQNLMAEAAASEQSVSIYVESFNPSLRFFERLGFTRKEESGFYYLMEWRSSSSLAGEPAAKGD